jgi:spore coat protein CotH
MGRSGLEYEGEDIKPYQNRFTMKSGKDDDWRALVQLCRLLKETPVDQLEQELSKVVDVDELLWFLALDNALINCDGYWIRASDYSMFRDPSGKFHFIPGDMNEAFRRPMGPGMGGFGPPRGGPPGFGPPGGNDRPGDNDRPPRPEDTANGDQRRPPESGAGGPGGGFGGFGGPGGPGGRRGGIAPVEGVKLDPLVGMDDESKPLRSKVLAVPSLRKKYLENVRTIAEKSLDWNKLGTVVAGYRDLLDEEVKADTRKLALMRIS